MELPSPQLLKPVRDVALPADGSVNGVTLSNDGRTLVTVVMRQELSVVQAAVSFWPEALALATLVAVLLIFKKWLRVLRHPQRPGVLYCRRCGYDLTGANASDAPCAECGSPAARMRGVYGRKGVWRLGRFVGAAAVFGVLTGIGYGLKLRDAALSLPLPTFHSHELFEKAKVRNDLWARKHSTMVSEVQAIDLAAPGAAALTLARVEGTASKPLVTPDGRSVLFSLTNALGEELIGVDSVSGRQVGRMRLFQGATGSVVAFQGNQAIVVTGSSSEDKARVVRWEPRGGEPVQLVEEPGVVFWTDARHAARASGDGRVVATMLRDSRPVFHVYDTSVKPARVLPAAEGAMVNDIAACSWWVVNGDGTEVYVTGQNGTTAWSIASGEARTMEATGRVQAVSNNRRLAAGFTPDTTTCLVYELETGKAVARLDLPGGASSPRVELADSGHVLAWYPSVRGVAGRAFVYELPRAKQRASASVGR